MLMKFALHFATGQSIIRHLNGFVIPITRRICIQNRSKKVESLFAVVYYYFGSYLCVNAVACYFSASTF